MKMQCFSSIVIILISVTERSFSELKPDIRSLHIQSDIRYRFATTLVTSRIANPANSSASSAFRVVLPDDAFISNFTLEIEGIIYPGIVKEKEEARQDYEEARRQGQNTGLVSKSPRATNSFNVEVNVAAFSKVTFNLTYQELLQRRLGSYKHKIYVNPGQPVDDLMIMVVIKESREILNLRVPPIHTDLITNDYNSEVNSQAVITIDDEHSARIVYQPSFEDQIKDETSGLAGQFIVEYDVKRAFDAGDVLVIFEPERDISNNFKNEQTEDSGQPVHLHSQARVFSLSLVVNNYFVHYIAPDVGTHIPKDILFILDVSGSMQGRKIDQLKVAMVNILDDLEVGDQFNIFTFESDVNILYPRLQDTNANNIESAKGKISSLVANGGTNIHSAILGGVRQLSDIGEERAPVIIFLTDGSATSGVTTSATILTDVLTANKNSEIPIFTLAFGEGANWDLLNKLALQNNGKSRRIYEDADSDLQITGFYDEISDTLLKNVIVKYLENTVDETSLTEVNLGSFYKGSEMVVSGRLYDPNNIKSSIEAQSANGDITLVLKQEETIVYLQDMPALIGEPNFAMVTEKIWAYMTIKELLKKVDSGLYSAEETDVFNERALNMSLEYTFVTRLTSMVVTLPQENKSLSQGSGFSEMFSNVQLSGRGISSQDRISATPNLLMLSFVLQLLVQKQSRFV